MTRSGRSSKAGIPVSSTSRTQTTRSMISPLDPTDIGASVLAQIESQGAGLAHKGGHLRSRPQRSAFQQESNNNSLNSG